MPIFPGYLMETLIELLSNQSTYHILKHKMVLSNYPLS
jgi:hypothetical protein